MKLNISDWESFCASDIFFLYNGSGITKEEIEDNPGSFPAVQSGADNNGCIGYISKDYCKAMNYTYEQLLAIIDDGLRDKQDPFLLFFMNTVEPIYEALSTSNMQLLFDTLGIRRYPITKKSEKMKWKEFEARLKKARDGKAIDVINTIVETKLVPVPSLVDGYYHLYFDAPDTIYGLDATIRDVLDLDYSQFRAAIEFLYPEAEFSTEHGVKGEEYDNVVFVISKGWNQYQFETYAPMITGRTPIPNGKQTSYERNRNLFYVCCSRPRKRLFFFVSVPIDASFRVFLDDLVGAENIYTYGQYLEAKQ